MNIQEGIRLAVEGRHLSSDDANCIMEEMMSGAAPPSQTASFLTAMRMKGETKEELLGFARCMRSRALRVNAPPKAVDLCGTGGDGRATFNISTIAAFVVAGAGVPVAKHGNRAVSSRSGSADLLHAMGIPFDLGPQGVERCLAEANLGFMFAPGFHASMTNVMQTRRELGVRTFFNILGPMANPAMVKRQLIGVYDPKVARTMAAVLKELGTEHAMVVHGNGIDEVTNLGPTQVTELLDGGVEEYSISPTELGLDLAEPHELAGGTALENARIALDILNGEESRRADVVAVNAAAAIYVAGKASNLDEGLRIAREAIRNGAALKKLVAFHGLCTELDSKSQSGSAASELRGKRIHPSVLKTRSAEVASDLAADISTMEKGPEHLRRLAPEMMHDPTILTVLTLNRLRKILSEPQVNSGRLSGSNTRLSDRVSEAEGIAVIGEYKPRSPGTVNLAIPPGMDEAAAAYTDIAGVSVLAEEDYFHGGIDLFREFREKTGLPMLLKDFVTSDRQVDAARDAGADAILLMAKTLGEDALDALVRASVSAGLEPLVEVHDESDLKKVVSCESYELIEMIGVNGRDLRTLSVDIGRTVSVRELMDDDKTVIAESGIASPGQLEALAAFDGVLIGSMFMRSRDLRQSVDETVEAARRVAR